MGCLKREYDKREGGVGACCAMQALLVEDMCKCCCDAVHGVCATQSKPAAEKGGWRESEVRQKFMEQLPTIPAV